MRYKSMTYELDTEKPEQGPKFNFTGMWSPRDIDRMAKQAMRALKQYKLELMRSDQDDAERKSKPKSKKR